MKIIVKPTAVEAGRAAAEAGADALRRALATKDRAVIVVATGASQFDMLDYLVQQAGIDWHRVIGFHLDEYEELPISHPASFRQYLWERFVRRLPHPLCAFHFIDLERDAAGEVQRLNELLGGCEVDVAFVGIGENGHLAFNDPPADFETRDPYIRVELDEACRRQQLGEGWFPRLDDVPRRAVSMSVYQIMQSNTIICTVPDARKAEAVRKTVEGEVSPMAPASILQRHSSCALFLDGESAGLLGGV